MPYLRRTLDKKESGTVITDFEYELDKAGIRLSMKDKDGKYWAFTYDPRYQLRSETKWSAKTGGSRNYQYAWLYDANGNRLVQHDDGVPTDYVYGANNQMTDAGAVDFTYDHFGNTKTKVDGGNTTTYGWDDEGHLTDVDYPGTANDDEHQYDGDGRRMRSKLAGASDWTEFVHDELTGEILMEYTLVGGTFTIKAVNTWGLGLISTNREGTKRYFHFDGLGSTRALTDSSETVQDTYEYNAFGVLESSTGSSTNPFRYVGQYGYYDDGAMGSASGLLLLGVRYYSPAHGRFWSAGQADSDYVYVLNTPTVLTDAMTALDEHPCEARTRDYCDEARRRGGKSRALNCFCHVSRIMCAYIRAGGKGAAFVDCMNRCIWKEYKSRQSPQWKVAWRTCTLRGMDARECCIKMVGAEQEAFTRCLSRCAGLPEAGEPPPWWDFRILPFPFGGSQLERQHAAIAQCCDGVFGEPIFL